MKEVDIKPVLVLKRDGELCNEEKFFSIHCVSLYSVVSENERNMEIRDIYPLRQNDDNEKINYGYRNLLIQRQENKC